MKPLIPSSALSMMFCPFGNYLHFIYPQMNLKYTTDISKSASYLDIHLRIDTKENKKNKKISTTNVMIFQ